MELAKQEDRLRRPYRRWYAHPPFVGAVAGLAFGACFWLLCSPSPDDLDPIGPGAGIMVPICSVFGLIIGALIPDP